MFTRNVCFSRSEWQDPRLMYPFPGAIGRFRIHGARILPPRPSFGVDRPEITHSAKNLPPLPDLSRHLVAGRGPANWPNGLCALRPGPGPLAVSRVSAIRPRAPRLHACQAAATRRATHRRHSHARAAPSSFTPAPAACASRCPLQPRATRVPRPSRTLRGLRHLRLPSASRTAANERNCAASSMRA